MRKTVTLLTVSAFSLLYCNYANAQTPTFEFEKDTASVETSGTSAEPEVGDVHIYNKIINKTDDDWNYVWRILEIDFPEGWTLYGLCDNKSCRPPQHPSLAEPYPADTAINISFGDEIYPWVIAPAGVAADGMGYIRLEVTSLTDEPYTDTTTFVLTKESTSSVANSRITDNRIMIYPNPLKSDVLSIYINKEVNASEITLFNVLGSKMLQKPVTAGAEIIKVDASSLSAGIYFINFTDKSGNIVSARKLIKE